MCRDCKLHGSTELKFVLMNSKHTYVQVPSPIYVLCVHVHRPALTCEIWTRVCIQKSTK